MELTPIPTIWVYLGASGLRALYRIFGIPINLLYISYGNLKIFRLDLYLVQKFKTGIGFSSLMPVS